MFALLIGSAGLCLHRFLTKEGQIPVHESASEDESETEVGESSKLELESPLLLLLVLGQETIAGARNSGLLESGSQDAGFRGQANTCKPTRTAARTLTVMALPDRD